VKPATSRTPIQDPKEELHRQVHPDLVDDDQPSWQAFCPMPKDAGEISVSAGTLASPEVSYRRFRENGFHSYGVLTVTVQECARESLDAYHAPLDDNDDGGPDEAHSVVDFNRLESKNQHKKKGKALLAVSLKRGWTYKPN
jgi:hypothetical protein